MATAIDCTIKEVVSRNPNAAGIALLIGNDYHGNRKGVANLTGPLPDTDKAHEVFSSLGAVCVPVTNKPAKEIKAIVKSLAEYIDYPKGYQYIVLVFSGHGNRSGVLLGNDGEKLSLDNDIINPFQPISAVDIARLPKLFFIDACRGAEETRVIQVPRGPTDDSDEMMQRPRGGEGLEQLRFPETGNMFVAFSTLEDKLSYESQRQGGTWIRMILEKVEHHADQDVSVIFQEVNDELMKRYQGTRLAIQQPELRTTLHGSFNFKKFVPELPSFPAAHSVSLDDQYTVKLNELKKAKEIKDREYEDLSDGIHVKLVVTNAKGKKQVFKSKDYSSTYNSINMARERVACEAVNFITQSTCSEPVKKPLMSRLTAGLKQLKQVPKSATPIMGLPSETGAMQELKNELVDRAGYKLTDDNYKITERTNAEQPQFRCTFVHSDFPRIQGDWRPKKKAAKNAMAIKVLKHYYTEKQN